MVLQNQDPTEFWTDPTRLETRTKESAMCASIRVENPDAKRNRDCLNPSGVHDRQSDEFLFLLPSRSIHAGTRKMVNYACAG